MAEQVLVQVRVEKALNEEVSGFAHGDSDVPRPQQAGARTAVHYEAAQRNHHPPGSTGCFGRTVPAGVWCAGHDPGRNQRRNRSGSRRSEGG